MLPIRPSHRLHTANEICNDSSTGVGTNFVNIPHDIVHKLVDGHGAISVYRVIRKLAIIKGHNKYLGVNVFLFFLFYFVAEKD